MSLLAPPPIPVDLATPLAPSEVADRLRRVPEPVAAGDLRVAVDEGATVTAGLRGADSRKGPEFHGCIVAKGDGSVLSGSVRAARRASGWVAYQGTGAVVAVGIAFGLVVAKGTRDLGWVAGLLAFGVAFGFLAYGTRLIGHRVLQSTAAALGTELAAPIEALAPDLPTRAVSGPSTKAILTFIVVLQCAAIVIRVGVDSRNWGLAVVSGIAFGLLIGGVWSLYRWYRPRVVDGRLWTGPRSVELARVTSVRANSKGLMLSDGTRRVTVPLALGRPRATAEAGATLRSSIGGRVTKDESQALAALALAPVISRCEIDPTTAAALRRPATVERDLGDGPRSSPGGIAVAVGALIGFAAFAVLLRTWR